MPTLDEMISPYGKPVEQKPYPATNVNLPLVTSPDLLGTAVQGGPVVPAPIPPTPPAGAPPPKDPTTSAAVDLGYKLSTASAGAKVTPEKTAPAYEKLLNDLDQEAKASDFPSDAKNMTARQQMSADMAKNLKILRDEYDAAKGRIAWAEVAETLGKGLALIGMGMYGVRHGVDAVSGVNFNKSNWDAAYGRVMDELKAKTAQVKDNYGAQDDAMKVRERIAERWRDRRDRAAGDVAGAKGKDIELATRADSDYQGRVSDTSKFNAGQANAANQKAVDDVRADKQLDMSERQLTLAENKLLAEALQAKTKAEGQALLNANRLKLGESQLALMQAKLENATKSPELKDAELKLIQARIDNLNRGNTVVKPSKKEETADKEMSTALSRLPAIAALPSSSKVRANKLAEVKAVLYKYLGQDKVDQIIDDNQGLFTSKGTAYRDAATELSAAWDAARTGGRGTPPSAPPAGTAPPPPTTPPTLPKGTRSVDKGTGKAIEWDGTAWKFL
jgi:hypothetical protein